MQSSCYLVYTKCVFFIIVASSTCPKKTHPGLFCIIMGANASLSACSKRTVGLCSQLVTQGLPAIAGTPTSVASLNLNNQGLIDCSTFALGFSNQQVYNLSTLLNAQRAALQSLIKSAIQNVAAGVASTPAVRFLQTNLPVAAGGGTVSSALQTLVDQNMSAFVTNGRAWMLATSPPGTFDFRGQLFTPEGCDLGAHAQLNLLFACLYADLAEVIDRDVSLSAAISAAALAVDTSIVTGTGSGSGTGTGTGTISTGVGVATGTKTGTSTTSLSSSSTSAPSMLVVVLVSGVVAAAVTVGVFFYLRYRSRIAAAADPALKPTTTP
jgi:hypothetical protein